MKWEIKSICRGSQDVHGSRNSQVKYSIVVIVSIHLLISGINTIEISPIKFQPYNT